MFRSLRFKLPAIFLAGLALSGLVATVIAARLFQDYAREQTIDELRREAVGIAVLYAENAGRETLSAGALEEATGDRLYYVPFAAGIELFPAQQFGLRALPIGRGRQRGARAERRDHVRVHAAERGPALPRRRVPARDRRHDLRRDHRREAGDGARRALGHAGAAARDRVPRRPARRGRAGVVPQPADHAARARALARGGRGGRGEAATSRCRSSAPATRSRTCRSASPRWRSACARPRSSSGTSS